MYCYLTSLFKRKQHNHENFRLISASSAVDLLLWQYLVTNPPEGNWQNAPLCSEPKLKICAILKNRKFLHDGQNFECHKLNRIETYQ